MKTWKVISVDAGLLCESHPRTGETKVPVEDVTTELEKILLETYGEIPEGYDVNQRLHLSLLDYSNSQRLCLDKSRGPDDPIMLKKMAKCIYF